MKFFEHELRKQQELRLSGKNERLGGNGVELSGSIASHEQLSKAATPFFQNNQGAEVHDSGIKNNEEVKDEKDHLGHLSEAQDPNKVTLDQGHHIHSGENVQKEDVPNKYVAEETAHTEHTHKLSNSHEEQGHQNEVIHAEDKKLDNEQIRSEPNQEDQNGDHQPAENEELDANKNEDGVQE